MDDARKNTTAFAIVGFILPVVSIVIFLPCESTRIISQFEMPVRNPAPEQPVRTYPSPNISDQVVIEFVTSELANSKPIEPGFPHPNQREFAGWKLGIQKVFPADANFFMRLWVCDETSSDSWNYALKFSAASVSAPIFIRSYREPKGSYTPRTKGSALQTVYKLTRTLAGGGYVVGSQPALTFSGGAGTGAAGHGVVAPDGTIAEFVLTSGGSGYTSAPTFTVAPPPAGGTTATGTAAIQPTGAVLVSEEALQFPPDSEFFAQYFNVVRVYETLPGPYIPANRYDPVLGVITGRQRAVLNSGQAAAVTNAHSLKYEGREGSSIVSWEIEESWDNSSFPLIKDNFYDPDRGPVYRTTQATIDTSTAGSSAISGGSAITTRYDGIADNPNLRKKIIETWAVPGPTITTTAVSDGGERITTIKTLVDATTVLTSNDTSGGTWTRKFGEKYAENTKVRWQVVVTTPDVFDKLFFSKTRADTVPERFKATIPAITSKHVLQGVASAPTLATGDLSRTEQQIDAFTFEREITNRDISSLPTLEGQKYDEELNVLIPYSEQVVAAGSAIGNASTEVTPLGGGLDLKVTYDLTAIASAFASFQLVFPGKANLDLPDVLTALDLVNEEHSGAGDSSTPFFSGSWSGQGSWSVDPSGTAQGSQTVIPELIPTIDPTYGNRKSTTRLVFLLPMPVTISAVLSKIASILGASVSDWPDFNPKPVHAILTGRQVSLQVHASYRVQDGGSDTGAEHAEAFVRGYSTEVGMVVKTKEIAPTIHGSLGSFSPHTIDSIDLTADAYYDSETQATPALSTSVEVRGAGATTGVTAIPSTGKRLLDSNGSPFRFNHSWCHAEIFDFANLH